MTAVKTPTTKTVFPRPVTDATTPAKRLTQARPIEAQAQNGRFWRGRGNLQNVRRWRGVGAKLPPPPPLLPPGQLNSTAAAAGAANVWVFLTFPSH
jgi:hypothetical protein